jgi:hypothetical protein
MASRANGAPDGSRSIIGCSDGMATWRQAVVDRGAKFKLSEGRREQPLPAGGGLSLAAVLRAGPVLHSSAPSLRGLEQLEHWSRTETFKAEWLLQFAPVVLQFIEL